MTPAPLFNRKMQVSLNVLQLLTKNGKMTTWDLSQQLNESQLFIFQVMSHLRRNGFVTGTPGQGGGYELIPGATHKTIIQLVESYGKRVTPSAALSAEAASQVVINKLALNLSMTLEALFNGGKQPEPPRSA